MSGGYYSICPRCGAALMMAGGCMSCGYPNGTLRDRTAADTALAEKSKGDPPLGYVRYELLAEAWDSISKLGRELFDARTRIGELEAMYETSHKSRLHAEDCVKRLEAENAKLRKCVEAADAYFSAKANAYLPFGWVYTEEQMSEAERWEEFASKANDDYDAARKEASDG